MELFLFFSHPLATDEDVRYNYKRKNKKNPPEGEKIRESIYD